MGDGRAVIEVDAKADSLIAEASESSDLVEVAPGPIVETISPDEILAEAIDHLARCRTADEIETIFAESDWEAELSGAEGFVEKLRDAKEQHLDRVAKIAAAQARQGETAKVPPAPPAAASTDASLPPPADVEPERGVQVDEVKDYVGSFLKRCADATTIQDVVSAKAYWDETNSWRFERNIPGGMIGAMKRAYSVARQRVENPEG